MLALKSFALNGAVSHCASPSPSPLSFFALLVAEFASII